MLFEIFSAFFGAGGWRPSKQKGENSRKGALTGDMGSALVSLSWWDWDEEKIRRSLPAIMSGELDALLNRK